MAGLLEAHPPRAQRVLGSPLAEGGPAVGPGAVEACDEGEKVEVRLRHRVSRAELMVSVPAEGTTFRDVLLEAARVLGDNSIVSAGRLVRPGQGQPVPYMDSELLGKRRRLLFVGPALGPRRADATAPPMAGEARPGAPTRAPALPSGAPRFSRLRAMGLLMELNAGLLNAKFQRRLRQLEHAHPKGSEEFRSLCGGLLSDLYLEVLPKYGVETTAAGVSAMLREIEALSAGGDPDLAKAGEAVVATLGFELVSLAAFAPEAASKVCFSPPKLGVNSMREVGASLAKPAVGTISLPVGASGAHRPAAVNTKTVVALRLQHSPDRERITLEGGAATVASLRERLWQEFGVPSRAVLLAKGAAGEWAPVSEPSSQPPGARPGGRALWEAAPAPRAVLLEGVAVLTRDASVHWRSLLEEDMLRAMGELNARYAEPAFQERVAWWRSAPMNEAASRIQSFRDEVNLIVGDVIATYGFEAPSGLRDWEVAVERFKRFPTFADLCRKTKVLLGTLSPEQAMSAQRAAADRRCCAHLSAHDIATTHSEGRLCVRTIPSELALIRMRHDAQSVLALLHARIYEENREELWSGGNVPGHEMPTLQAMARKYTEPVGAFLLQCTATESADGLTVGGAAIFPLSIRLPPSAMGPDAAALPSAPVVEDDGGSPSESSAAEGPWRVAACYVDAFAATPGWRAGPAMVEHLHRLAEKEGWGLILLHSIKVKPTLAFWSRQGFHRFGEGAGTEFKFFCTQNFGFPLSKELVERQFPARPGCVMFAKAIHR